MNYNSISLYRYIPFERFIQMLFTKQIAVVSPSKWNDGYELYWLKMLDSVEGQAKLRSYLEEFKGDQEKSIQRIKQLSGFIFGRTYCLCFSECKDSEVLWRANSDNVKSIMFGTTPEKIYSLFSDDDMATIKQVKYDLEESGKFTDLIHLFDVEADGAGCWNTDELFLHKRACFKYEKEHRLLVKPAIISGENIRKYTIPNLQDFITCVMVHPLASEEYVDLIKCICDQFQLNFAGQSTVYRCDQLYD